MRDFNNLTKDQKHIFIWIRYIDFEFRMSIKNLNKIGYEYLINEIVNPIMIDYLFKDNNKAIELCKLGMEKVKFINGNHFHIYLFSELEKMIEMEDINNKLEFIFNKVKESGTKNSVDQFIYTVEEIGEIAEVLRCLNNDVRKKDKTKKDLAYEIGDTLITLFLITKFEGLDFFNILITGINKEYKRWSKNDS